MTEKREVSYSKNDSCKDNNEPIRKMNVLSSAN